MVLITSATSGVGVAIIDALRGRRESLQIIGLSTDVSGQFPDEFNIFLQSPPTNDSSFAKFVEETCLRYGVELVIAGRDDDVVALGELHDNPDSLVTIQSGPGWLVKIFRDKYLAHNWCKSHQIEFAETITTDSPKFKEELDSLISRKGFPFVLKPREGDGSRGVKLILNSKHLEKAIVLPNHVIQEFIGTLPSGNLEPDLTFGIPLFWNFPEIVQATIVFVMDNEKRNGEFFTCEVKHNQGVVQMVSIIDDVGLNDLGSRILEQLFLENFQGICSFSVLQEVGGGWKTIEINPRFTGGTAIRMLLGFDEVAKTLNMLLGQDQVVPPAVLPRIYNQVNRKMRDLFPDVY